jgi:hypothetical protein
VKRWLSYAVAGLLLTVLVALVAVAVAGPAGRAGIWFAAGVAYLIQLAAFAALLAVHGDAQLFVVGWAGGMLLRFGLVGAMAFWLSRSQLLPLQETLISLVVFLVLLLFLEPFFLRGHRPKKVARAGRSG